MKKITYSFFASLFTILICNIRSFAQLSVRESAWKAAAGTTATEQVALRFGVDTLRVENTQIKSGINAIAFIQRHDTLTFYQSKGGNILCGDSVNYQLQWQRNGERMLLRPISGLCGEKNLPWASIKSFQRIHDDGSPLGNWSYLDLTDDSVPGISLYKAYALLKGRPSKKVVVAVIDGGVDIGHEDLAPIIWTNPGEVPGNGVDDDHNGYIDDLHGWNFRGVKDSATPLHDPFEDTRIYASWKDKYDAADPQQLNDKEKKEWTLYTKARKHYLEKIAELHAIDTCLNDTARFLAQLQAFAEGMTDKFFTTQNVRDLPAKDSFSVAVKRMLLYYSASFGALSIADMVSYFDNSLRQPGVISFVHDYVRQEMMYDYNLAYHSRKENGENPIDPEDRFYGSPIVKEKSLLIHGTKVSSIIAGQRQNGKGIDGIADNVLILPIAAVPQGDERDKDIANAIRYAVANGARIINMSFTKQFSPQKMLVDQAVRFAESKGVLLFRAAGNDSNDTDTAAYYPSAVYDNGKKAENLIIVGNSSASYNERLINYQSNYGATTVDLFAPGTDILVATPDDQYEFDFGTSFASPCAAGVAALLFSYFPSLTVSQVKDILLKSAFKPTLMVKRPDSNVKVPFNSLSVSGGIVNAYSAVKMAITITSKK